MRERNYSERIGKIDGILKVWKERQLTLLGKITIINTLVISQLMHLFLMMPTPDNFFITFVKRMIYDFLWEGKRGRIRQEKLYQDYILGGL